MLDQIIIRKETSIDYESVAELTEKAFETMTLSDGNFFRNCILNPNRIDISTQYCFISCN